MTEEAIFINGPVRLEARLARAKSPAGGVVVCHPHPLYGGSMDNNVVQALMAGAAQVGWTGLRFNFRGMGQSGGAHDQGRGEAEDILAALDYLAGLGLNRLVVAGYSFGVWVAARTDFGSRPVVGQIWVAPPVGMMPIDPSGVKPTPDLIITGDRDEIAPSRAVDDLTDELAGGEPVRLNLAGADHFFGGFEGRITAAAGEALGKAATNKIMAD